MHSQRLKNKNTRGTEPPWRRSLQSPQRLLQPLVPRGASFGRHCCCYRVILRRHYCPLLPRLPGPGARVSSSSRALSLLCLRGGGTAGVLPPADPALLPTLCPWRELLDCRTDAPRKGTPEPPRQSPALKREAPPLPKQAGHAPPPRRSPGRGEGEDGTRDALDGRVNPPTPPPLLLPPRPTKYYSSKQQGGHL